MDSLENFDVFISYCRKDKLFAQKLVKALETYTPPRGLDLPRKHPNAFLDEEDLVGADLNQSIAENLERSKKLIVICSPFSRKSPYVNSEIELFLNKNKSENIIPILLSGIPNNEANKTQENEKAFPESLINALPIPLAINYRDFPQKEPNLKKGILKNSWYKLLACIYNKDQEKIEEREKKRIKQKRMFWGTISLFLLIVFTSTLLYLYYKNKEDKKRQAAFYIEKANKAKENGNFDEVLLFSASALEKDETNLSAKIFAGELSNLPKKIAESEKINEAINFTKFYNLDKNIIVKTDSGKIILFDRNTLKVIKTLIKRNSKIILISISKDKSKLALGYENQEIEIFNISNEMDLERPVFKTKINEMPLFLDISSKGNYLAAGNSYMIEIIDIKNNKKCSYAVKGERIWSADDMSSIKINNQENTLAIGYFGGKVRIFEFTSLFNSDKLEFVTEKLAIAYSVASPGVSEWDQPELKNIVFHPNDEYVSAISILRGEIYDFQTNFEFIKNKKIDNKFIISEMIFSNQKSDMIIASKNREQVSGNITIFEDKPKGINYFNDNFTSIDISIKDEFLVTGTEKGCIILWKLVNYKKIVYSQKFQYEISKTCFSTDNHFLKLIRTNGNFHIVDISKNQIIEEKSDIKFLPPVTTVIHNNYSINLLEPGLVKIEDIKNPEKSIIIDLVIPYCMKFSINTIGNSYLISAISAQGTAIYIYDIKNLFEVIDMKSEDGKRLKTDYEKKYHIQLLMDNNINRPSLPNN